jgi:hypothetical protein
MDTVWAKRRPIQSIADLGKHWLGHLIGHTVGLSEPLSPAEVDVFVAWLASIEATNFMYVSSLIPHAFFFIFILHSSYNIILIFIYYIHTEST